MTGRVFIGRYECLRLLGEGGMGRVFYARDRQSGREVVVKVLHDHIAAQPRFRESFHQEMLCMARLHHPNVVTLIDASIDDPQGLCIVMEFIRGVTLSDLLEQQRRLDVERTGGLLGQLCLALHAAQKLEIIHRDLKPANLMVQGPDAPTEKLKVMDFGLAKLASAVYIPKERLDNPDQFFFACGTPDYICPEQVRGDEIDHRSDLYSVGIILYEMLTGSLPFSGPNVDATMLAHANARPPRFARVDPETVVPPAVEQVVLSCLAKYPNERPQTAQELVERFEKAAGHKFVAWQDWQRPVTSAPSRGGLPALSAFTPKPNDPNAIVHQFEAWMPERIAVVKLQGFVHDIGGEVVESVPGMIRVRLSNQAVGHNGGGRQGLLSLLGLKSKSVADHIEMELRMEKKEGSQQGQLRITVLMRPPAGQRQPPDAAWRNHCEQLHRELRAYLISRL
jgi:serine/threonine protein kinase